MIASVGLGSAIVGSVAIVCATFLVGLIIAKVL